MTRKKRQQTEHRNKLGSFDIGHAWAALKHGNDVQPAVDSLHVVQAELHPLRCRPGATAGARCPVPAAGGFGSGGNNMVLTGLNRGATGSS